MPDFHAIHQYRSDGVLAISGGPGGTQKNRPTDDQLKKTKDASGITRCYTKINHGNQKDVEWRKKLGGMLAKEIAVDEEQGMPYVTQWNHFLISLDNTYILSQLPQNYVLWEMQQWSDT